MDNFSEFQLVRYAAGLDLADAAKLLGRSPATLRNWENLRTEPEKAALELLRRIARDREKPRPAPDNPAFDFVDLFAGIGGMRQGFEAAGGQCVFTSEWNPYAVQTYVTNFGYDHPLVGNIRSVKASEIPRHDVLLAGFPCQPFSIAGVSKKRAIGQPDGFLCEDQGNLFFEIVRILEHHRPQAFVLENVKNLRSHDGGHTFGVIIDALERELGYQVQTRIIDARNWVPQHRERIFIVGFREPCGFDLQTVKLVPSDQQPKMKAVLHPEDGTEAPESPYTEGNIGRVAGRYVLSDHLWSYLQEYARKHSAKGNGFGFGTVGPEDVARTLSARYYKDGAEILVRRPCGPPRRLTPRECGRLMGFDLSYPVPYEIPVSDTQAYKQFGNSVAVPVVAAVATAMLPFLSISRLKSELALAANG